MQINFKKWLVLVSLTPAFVVAQPLNNQSASKPVATNNCTNIDADKRTAINDLLNTINAKELGKAIGRSGELEAKQLAAPILLNALTENKTLSEQQKQEAAPNLEKNVLPNLANKSGKQFLSQSFEKDAIDFQFNAYCKFYSTDEIKALTTFYKSPTGQKFIQQQDQVGHEVVNGLLQKYMPQSIEEIRKEANKEIEKIKPKAASTSTNSQRKTN